MSLQAGIVGLPNVGKSTLFNARRRCERELFCTIEPNKGIVPVPDPRLDQICAHIKTQKVIPAVVEIATSQGLCAARAGEGLGSQFLGYIRAPTRCKSRCLTTTTSRTSTAPSTATTSSHRSRVDLRGPREYERRRDK